MAWGDSQVLVGDFVYLDYGGYRWGHKAERFTERQIGFAHMPRDRYVSLAAGETQGTLRTRSDTLRAAALTVNARVDWTVANSVCASWTRRASRMRLRLAGLRGDQRRRVAHRVAWKSRLGTSTGSWSPSSSICGALAFTRSTLEPKL